MREAQRRTGGIRSGAKKKSLDHTKKKKAAACCAQRSVGKEGRERIEAKQLDNFGALSRVAGAFARSLLRHGGLCSL